MTFDAVGEKQARGWIEEAELEMDNWVISHVRERSFSRIFDIRGIWGAGARGRR